jgi:hypothetical protein
MDGFQKQARFIVFALFRVDCKCFSLNSIGGVFFFLDGSKKALSLL